MVKGLLGVWVAEMSNPWISEQRIAFIAISDIENDIFSLEIVDTRITHNGHERKKWLDYAKSLV
jgi:hypothetical protein